MSNHDFDRRDFLKFGSASAIAATTTGPDLEPGASKTVNFVVPMSVLAYTGIPGELVMEPGPVEMSAGSSSSDIRSRATFSVTGKTRAIRGEDRVFLSVATVG